MSRVGAVGESPRVVRQLFDCVFVAVIRDKPTLDLYPAYCRDHGLSGELAAIHLMKTATFHG
jgi:hypothetical protein